MRTMSSPRCAIAMLALIAATACGKERTEETARATSAVEDSAPAATQAPAAEYAAVAANLVNRAYRVKPGDLVLITGGQSQLELLEDIAIEVRRAGAQALITVESARGGRLSYEKVPAERDRDAPELALALTRTFDGFINVESDESTAWLAEVPPERVEARAVAGRPATDLSRKLQRKFVFLGNGMTPTDDNAKSFGLSKAELTKIFWAGINTDYDAIAANGAALAAKLRNAKEARVTTPGGTDLTFALAGGDALVSDGSISDDDLKRGSAGRLVWLPAGEVYKRVAPGTAKGVVVAERYPWLGGEVVEGLRLEVAGGRITALSAAKGLQGIKSRYDAAGKGKDLLTVLDVGINPSVAVPPGAVLPFVAAGLVTLNFGGDTWAGGTNDASINVGPFLTNATLTLDGETVVEGGKLKLKLATVTAVR